MRQSIDPNAEGSTEPNPVLAYVAPLVDDNDAAFESMSLDVAPKTALIEHVHHDARLTKSFPKRALCVCSGNICRSPYAEYAFRHLAKQKGSETQVFSAGTLKISGENAAPLMQRAAKEAGHDLSAHRSSPLSRLLIDASDIVLVMSPEHRLEVLRISPSADEKTLILAHWLNPPKLEIADPMGLSYEHYRRAVVDIDAALEQLFLSFEP